MGGLQSNQEERLKSLDKDAQSIGIGGEFSPEKDENSYKSRMQNRKEVQSKRLASRSKEKGLIIVFTGSGKGKTTAALGMALRALGHNQNVAIIQFIKGGLDPGERKALSLFGPSF